MIRVLARLLFISYHVLNFDTAFADIRGACDRALDDGVSARVHMALRAINNAPTGIALHRPGQRQSPMALVAHPDPLAPSMYTLGPLSDAKKPDHEIRTARDYAEFLSAQGRTFVYLSDFKGRSVPVFDGLIIDSASNETLAAVSLKYHSVRVERPKARDLVHDIYGRLNMHRQLSQLASPQSWFETVTGRRYLHPQIHDWLYWHTRTLMNIFGLFQTPHEPYPDIQLVVDMRDHGYPFEFVTEPRLLDAISKAVQKKSEQRISLTLLWNSRQVIEFTANEGARTY